jgi:hypothetical protein
VAGCPHVDNSSKKFGRKIIFNVTILIVAAWDRKAKLLALDCNIFLLIVFELWAGVRVWPRLLGVRYSYKRIIPLRLS